MINTLKPRQNGQHFADNIFKRMFFNGNFWILLKISLKFVPKGLINSSIGSDNDSPPSRRQGIIWSNAGYFSNAYMPHSSSMS